jgi:hypothetical protein
MFADVVTMNSATALMTPHNTEGTLMIRRAKADYEAALRDVFGTQFGT